ncbi:hypothetical protein [Salmonella enterica]|uniref:hypothetical protein n=1 Tax=Salmonella enterica TaxID=28901 RepID=UPI0015C4DC8F|nr:hypothetical protein [Salmonella enterica]EEU8018369.1 hypothetical protein [Salmonella enterica subsp. enterica serovar Montevideo]EGW6888312.1 hypothetical protein [Salmonella enterica]EIF1280656.1 hypothetical protein [Salmonella enterica]EIT6700056.1 hypothetical protein [Salmonella enterica]EJF7143491.1 hypothetical protein [Salmonella enterica]
MHCHWKQLLNESHANAFRLAALSLLAAERCRYLVAQAISEGLAPEDFCYLTEREMKNG